MFISEAAALSIVQEMKEITGHDINIMDGTGTIFASTDPGRVGQRHEGACQILSQKLPRLTVQGGSVRASTSPSSWTGRR